jgi:hypothetical protein
LNELEWSVLCSIPFQKSKPPTKSPAKPLAKTPAKPIEVSEIFQKPEVIASTGKSSESASIVIENLFRWGAECGAIFNA